MNAISVFRTLQAKGQPMVLTRSISGVYDPITGAVAGGTEQTFTVYGITNNYKLANVATPNSLILSGDKEALISADIKPLIADKLQIMGEDWIVISINELSPQGVALMYSCQIRK